MAKSSTTVKCTAEQPIPRPLNCFLLYRLEKQKEIVAKCAGANHRDISKIIAKWWKETTEEEKKPYRERARIAKMEHRKLYPDYKYTPKKKASPKRVYIRRNKKDKFTSRAKENNELMEMIYKDPTALEAITEEMNVQECSVISNSLPKKSCKVNKSISENTVIMAGTVYEDVDDIASPEEEYSYFEKPSCRYARPTSSFEAVPHLKFDSQLTSPLTDSYSEADMSSPLTEQGSMDFGMPYSPILENEVNSPYFVLNTPFINDSNVYSCLPLEQQLDYFQIASIESQKSSQEMNWNDFSYMFTETYHNSLLPYHQPEQYINPAMLHM